MPQTSEAEGHEPDPPGSDSSLTLRSLIEGVQSHDIRCYEQLLKSYDKFVFGIVRGILGPSDTVEDVVQEVRLALWLYPPQWDPKLETSGFVSWLRQVAHNKAVSRIRALARKTEPTAADFEWLFESSRGGGIPPHRAIVAGMHVMLRFSHKQIVDDFSDVPLAALAQQLANACKDFAFDALISELTGEEGKTTLRDLYPQNIEPEQTISSWVSSLGAAAKVLRTAPEVSKAKILEPTGPPSLDPLSPGTLRESVQLVLSETRAPHQELIFLLNKFLDVKPAEMGELMELPLDELLENVFVRCTDLELRSISKTQWEEYFKPLQDVMSRPVQEVIADADTLASYHGVPKIAVGRTKLRDYGEQDISHWVNSAQKRFMSKVHESLQDFLSAVFNSKSQAHKALTFAYTALLRVAVADFIWSSSTPLRELTSNFFQAYLKRMSLKQGRLKTCLRPLEQQLQHRKGGGVVGDTTLNDYYTTNGRNEREGELVQWREEVQRRTLADLEHRQKGLIYAYASGYL